MIQDMVSFIDYDGFQTSRALSLSSRIGRNRF